MFQQFIFLILSLLFTVPVNSAYAVETITQPYRGITVIHRIETSPRPENIHVVKINLADPAIRFKLSPGTPPIPNQFSTETRVQTTLDFLIQEKAQLAINVHFFDHPPRSDGGTNLTGFAASMGTVYSAFDPVPVFNFAILPNAAVLNLDASNHAVIAHRADSDQFLKTVNGRLIPYNTVCGSAQIITDGVKTIPAGLPPRPNKSTTATTQPVYFYTDQIAARTAIGLSKDCKTLYLFTVDAAGESKGMKIDEMADFLLSAYAIYNALNLDGGGSTSLAMADPATGTGRIINTVINQRPVGSSLAVFVDPIPSSMDRSALIITITCLLIIFAWFCFRRTRPKHYLKARADF
jgi:hypothetical protein